MNNQVVEIVLKSQWLEQNATNFMNISLSTPTYLVVERIWINVSASFGIKWQQVEHANEFETKAYAARIITMLLIISTLSSKLQMKNYEINILIGKENQDLIDEYFEYIKFKKS